MKFGLTREEFEELKKTVLEPLVSKGAQIWCFGSRARGDHHPYSDIDIMVDSTEDLASLVAELREHFEKSNFPYKVDIVEKKKFAKAYLPNFEKEKLLF